MYTAKDIRNIALLGHGGDGKSALCESMLFNTKAITRLGKRADGTTVSDFDDEEKKRQYSIKTSVIPVEYKGSKINVLDNPGSWASGKFWRSGRLGAASASAAGSISSCKRSRRSCICCRACKRFCWISTRPSPSSARQSRTLRSCRI